MISISDEVQGHPVSPYYKVPLSQKVKDRDNSEPVIRNYYEYVNRKGKKLVQVTEEGIDKYSSNYNPSSGQINQVDYDSSYCIKTIGNTFVNHIIGTVGFSVAEYYGYDFVNTTWTSYNIVQVVHGIGFTKSTKVLSRWKYSYTHRKDIFGKDTWQVCYDFPSNNHTLVPVLQSNKIHIVHTVGQFPITKNYYSEIRRIENYNAVQHDGIPVPVPNEQSYTYEVDKIKYREYRLYLGSLKKKKIFSIFKNIYPLPHDKSKNEYIYQDSKVKVVTRPTNIDNNHRTKTRYWKYLQFLLWATDNQYPAFEKDFYNIRYKFTRDS
jgi:hypothetical protein